MHFSSDAIRAPTPRTCRHKEWWSPRSAWRSSNRRSSSSFAFNSKPRHQAKFRVVDAAALAQTLQSASDSAVVVEDNVPVPFAVANSGNIADNQNGYCTIEQWRNRQCTSQPIVIDLPFSQTGEFLYHCH